MKKGSSTTSGPCPGPRVIRTRPKGRGKGKSGHRHRRETGEGHGRETSRRTLDGQMDYKVRES